MNAAIHILLVEDSPTDVLLTEEALCTNRFHVQRSQRLGDALKLLKAKQFDVILLDLGLPDSQGLDTLRTLRVKNPQVAVVVLTGKDDEELALQALKEGAQDYLVKGELQAGLLQRAIRYAVERSGTETMLRRSEERFQELTAHIHQVLWVMDAREAKILYVSPGYEQMWGRSCQSLIDNPQPYMEGIHPHDLEMMQRENAIMFQTGRIDAECRVLRPDGSVRWIWIRGYPVKEQGQIVRIVGVIEDITEKRQLEEQYHQSQERLQHLVSSSPAVLFTLGIEKERVRGITWMSDNVLDMLGYSARETYGEDWWREHAHPDDIQPIVDIVYQDLLSKGFTAHEYRFLHRSGSYRWVRSELRLQRDAAGKPIEAIGSWSDITERMQLEQQFQQAQKMEAVGQLAGGVAHDFNNLLTIISGYSEILLPMLGPNDPMRESVKAISEAGERAASLTRQLLAFSRKTVLEPKVLDLNEVVRETGKLLRRLIGEDILFTTVLDPAISRVKVDPDQFGQVLMNLAVNARDAMPKGGKLTMETRNAELDREYTRLHPEATTGRYVLLSISDTGSGMSAEVKARIFEPFFTTKEVGKGTGLGLAVVLGVVKQSGGHIEVFSEPDVGTTFKIYLPTVEEKASGSKLIEVGNSGRGTETILVVEDEDGVRGLAVLVLKTYGYKVMAAGNGKEAMRLAAKHQGGIDLLVTDVVMPGMGGPDLAEALHPSFPKMKVLFSSGYTDDAVIRHGLLQEKVAFLQKPYSPLALVRKVRQVLDEK